MVSVFNNNWYEIDVTRLVRKEVECASDLFDRYGLWGARLSWPQAKKFSFISADCSSELPSLLLDVFKSKNLLGKYKAILSENSNRPNIEAILICLFALEVMEYTPQTYHIQELLGGKNINWTWIKTYGGLKSIINFESRGVNARSSVLGLHLLHNLFSAKQISEILIIMTKEAESRNSDKEFRFIQRDLIRYRFLSIILPEHQMRQSTINYYEGVRNLASNNKNPQFWLQYAIGCLTHNQLDRAETYFADAYSLANNLKDYNTYQIDNHYSRFLLEKALDCSDNNTAFPFFERAKTIIFEQMRRESRHYPFRASLGIFKVYKKWKVEWSKTQIETYKKAFLEVIKRCNMVDNIIKNNRYVTEALKEATACLKTIPD